MATLASIEAAVNTALAATLATATPTPGPFAAVRRWLGEVRAMGRGVTLDRVALGQLPACLLEWQGETADNDVQTTAAVIETRGKVALRAWVVQLDVRGPDALVAGGTAPTSVGIAACVDAVVAALNGLEIAGLLRSEVLRYKGCAQRLADVQTYAVYEVTFEAQRSVPTVTPADTSHAMTDLTGDANIVGDTSTDTNPLVRFRAAV